jgi:hypothetical protein
MTKHRVNSRRAFRRRCIGAIRLHCVETEVSLMQFVGEALAEKLKRNSGRQRRA